MSKGLSNNTTHLVHHTHNKAFLLNVVRGDCLLILQNLACDQSLAFSTVRLSFGVQFTGIDEFLEFGVPPLLARYFLFDSRNLYSA